MLRSKTGRIRWAAASRWQGAQAAATWPAGRTWRAVGDGESAVPGVNARAVHRRCNQWRMGFGVGANFGGWKENSLSSPASP